MTIGTCRPLSKHQWMPACFQSAVVGKENDHRVVSDTVLLQSWSRIQPMRTSIPLAEFR